MIMTGREAGRLEEVEVKVRTPSMEVRDKTGRHTGTGWSLFCSFRT